MNNLDYKHNITKFTTLYTLMYDHQMTCLDECQVEIMYGSELASMHGSNHAI